MPDTLHDQIPIRRALVSVYDKAGLDELASTDLGLSDLMEWRKGCDHARRITPLGYFGDPAASTAEYGRYTMFREAQAIVGALKERLAAEA